MSEKLNNLKSKIYNRYSEDIDEIKKIIKDEKKTFRLNRLLANKLVIKIELFLMDIFLLICFNFVCNSFSNMAQAIGTRAGISTAIKFSNILIPFGKIFTSGGWLTLYILFAVITVIVDVFLVYQIKTSLAEKTINKEQDGDSRWTTDEEIKAQYLEIDEMETEYAGMPGYPISRIGDKIYIDQSVVNNLCIAITRGGKGEVQVFPSIDTYTRAQIKPSLVVIDMKAELFKASQKVKTLEKRGYEVHFMNLQEPFFSMGYNPLELIIEQWEQKNYSFAEELTHTFAWQIFDPESETGNNKYFTVTAAYLFEGLVLGTTEDAIRADKEINELRLKAYERKTKAFNKLEEEEKTAVRKEVKNSLVDKLLDKSYKYYPSDIEFEETHENRKKINMYSIIVMYSEMISDKELDEQGHPTGNTALDYFFLNRNSENRARLKYLSLAGTPSKTKGNVYSTMNTKLTLYTLENVAKMTAESSINIADIGFGEKPMAIFLGVPDADKSKHQIVTSFIKQVYALLAALCWDGGKCKRPVKFICDEIGNFPKIDDFANILTVCLGRNISFDLYIQSYTQLDKVYGREDAKTIRSNCGNKIYIRTDDEDTRNEFSKMVGSETIITLQRNGRKLALLKAFYESTKEKPLISPVQLERLKKGETVIVRTMKTTDNSGKEIYMSPIFNSIENGKQMKFRYQYLEDYFASPDKLLLSEINTESREHIKLKNRRWNYGTSFEFMKKDDDMEKNICVKDMEDREIDKFIEVLNEITPDETKSLYNNDFTQMPIINVLYLLQQSVHKDKEGLCVILEKYL